ncbi:MAG: type II secretion system major pseudopilin GspG [Reinekea sp.]|jgi:general secretion pathway protein G|nr:type II secretion system major pseudopilin GspG [Reinekea sp.]MDX1474695.1 type II secretion system major pseudopilin GspG [Reinekea sp.]
MKKQAGFTLIELMVVLVILGIIMGLVVPNVIGRGDEARVTAAETDIQTIGQALEMYRLHNSHYPSTDQGLEALVSKPGGSPEPKNWRGPYLPKTPKDPWGNPYGYINDGGSPEVISYGADNSEGGEGLNQDISTATID